MFLVIFFPIISTFPWFLHVFHPSWEPCLDESSPRLSLLGWINQRQFYFCCSWSFLSWVPESTEVSRVNGLGRGEASPKREWRNRGKFWDFFLKEQWWRLSSSQLVLLAGTADRQNLYQVSAKTYDIYHRGKPGAAALTEYIQYTPSPLYWDPLMAWFLAETVQLFLLPRLHFSLQLLFASFSSFPSLSFLSLFSPLFFFCSLSCFPFSFFVLFFPSPFQHVVPLLCLYSHCVSVQTAQESTTEPCTLREARFECRRIISIPWLQKVLDHFRSQGR